MQLIEAVKISDFLNQDYENALTFFVTFCCNM